MQTSFDSAARAAIRARLDEARRREALAKAVSAYMAEIGAGNASAGLARLVDEHGELRPTFTDWRAYRPGAES